MKSLRIFLLSLYALKSIRVDGYLAMCPGNRNAYRTSSVMLYTMHQDTVILWRGLQGLQQTFKRVPAERTGQLWGFLSSPFAHALVYFHLKGPFCSILSDASGRTLLFWPWSGRSVRLFHEHVGSC